MKFRSLAILLVIILCCSSCDKNSTPLFEMEMFFELDIPAGLNTLESHFFIVRDVPTFASSLLTGNGVDPEDIGFINGLTATMETRFSGLDLDFVEDIGVHFFEDDISTRQESFYVFNDFIEFGNKTEIPMIPTLVDFKDVLLQETVDIEFKINLRAFIPSELDTRVTMRFNVFPPE